MKDETGSNPEGSRGSTGRNRIERIEPQALRDAHAPGVSEALFEALASVRSEEARRRRETTFDEAAQRDLQIRRVRDHERAAETLALGVPQPPAQGRAAEAPPTQHHPQTLPAEIEQGYVRDADGVTFRKRTALDRIAFEDHGASLRTRSSAPETADALVRIAQARGWEAVHVRGTEAFRREAFLEASARGLKVSGYSATREDVAQVQARAQIYSREKELAHARGRAHAFATLPQSAALEQHPDLLGAYVAKEVARQLAAQLDPQDAPRVEATMKHLTTQRLAAGEVPRAVKVKAPEGVVLEHGHAPYRFQRDADPSYFVRFKRDDGQVREVWGKGLESAMRDAQATEGSRVRLQVTGAKPVTVDRRTVDAQGKVTREKQDAERNEWKIEVMRERVARERVRARSAPARAPAR